MISSTTQVLRVYLAGKQTPLFIGSCVRHSIAADAKDRLFVSFSYDSIEGLFLIDHEKEYARTQIREQSYSAFLSLPLEHSKTCPCLIMHKNPDIYSFNCTKTFIRLSCSTLVLDSKNRILLTRRDRKLRSFPGAWVNPGGRLDPGESLNECAIRELKEEVGITIQQKEGFKEGEFVYTYQGKECEVKPFMVYESVFPTHLDQGFPRAHYLVVFYSVKIPFEFSKIKVKVQEDEVDKGIWIDLPTLMNGVEKKHTSEPLNCYSIGSGTSKSDTIASESFEGIYPNPIKEGLGEGHLIAIKHYYSKNFRTMDLESS